MSAIDPLQGLDPVITAPKRLAIVALLSRASTTDFGFLRDHLRISDSDLSKQMSALEAAGYVSVNKLGRGRGGATTYAITKAGSRAYKAHRAALRELLAD